MDAGATRATRAVSHGSLTLMSGGGALTTRRAAQARRPPESTGRRHGHVPRATGRRITARRLPAH